MKTIDKFFTPKTPIAIFSQKVNYDRVYSKISVLLVSSNTLRRQIYSPTVVNFGYEDGDEEVMMVIFVNFSCKVHSTTPHEIKNPSPTHIPQDLR